MLKSGKIVGNLIFDQARKMAVWSMRKQRDGTSIGVVSPESLAAELLQGGEEIPIVDLRRLIDPQSSEAEFRKLKFACGEWGFFKLINHGVPREVINQMKADVIEFFKLPDEEKKAYAPLPNGFEGYGQVFVDSEDEKLNGGNLFYLVTQPVASRKMKLWPSTLKDTLHKYSSEMKKLAGILLNLLSNDLGLDPDVLLNIFKDEGQGLAMNYYRPCPKADKVLGFLPHTDATAFTFILEVNDVLGLHIGKEGKWVPVKPTADAFVVNIGDSLEILSNGKYRSLKHRVMMNTESERLSVATFHGPDGGCMLGPLPELVRGGKENYMTMRHAEYLKKSISEKQEGRSFLDKMRLE